MQEQKAKAKGVVDIIFLIDKTGSMTPCIDALKENISTFIDALSSASGNNPTPVKDWRAKVVGYGDVKEDAQNGINWLIDNDFVRNVDELKKQLSNIRAEGGGHTPEESLLDALYLMATMKDTGKDEDEKPTHWRYRSRAARVVVVFTDIGYHPQMAIPEAEGGTVDDVINKLMDSRIILSIFAPENDCYYKLAECDKSEYNPIPLENRSPQEALKDFTKDQSNFKKTLEALAKSVSASAATEAL
jgi:hypothetical protein